MSLTSLQDVFVEQLKDIYSAEKQILKALPKMAKAASSVELQDAFQSHLAETKLQVLRLDQVIALVGVTGKGKKCKGMEGLLEEGKETMQEDGDASGAALDAALIADAQRVEHYEIAAYGTLCSFAKQLGQREALELLKETLNEEEQADKKLSDVASTVNMDAASSHLTESSAPRRRRKIRAHTGS